MDGFMDADMSARCYETRVHAWADGSLDGKMNGWGHGKMNH